MVTVLSQIAKRVLRLVPIFLIVTFATTALIGLLPGDPAVELAGEYATEEQLAAVNAKYGFDDPLLMRYADWVGKVLTGDFGTSYRTNEAVLEAVLSRLPVTVELAVLATLMALLIGIPMGMLTAYRANSVLDNVAQASTSALISIPSFLMALLLVFIFAVRLGWFPVTGWVRLTDDPIGNLRTAFLPMLTLAIGEMVVIQRVLRVDMIHTLKQDFMMVARAKGIPTVTMLRRHALRPSSFSLLTLTGLSIGRMIAGAVIVESVFALPGLGRLLILTIQTKDIVMVQGIVLFIAVIYLLINLATDLLYVVVDPRLRHTT